MIREIVLDTETTGLNPRDGHKVIEIGCVELINHLPTGNTFHAYINPSRDVPQEAYNISGLSTEFLKQYESFEFIAEGFLDFIQGDPLIIHNAPFDMGFLNFELGLIKKEFFRNNSVVDTLKMARAKFPGSPASLDALCRRFKIDNSSRIKHGALIDCELLAAVYLELIGGRQIAFNLNSSFKKEKTVESITIPLEKSRRDPREFLPTLEEKMAHSLFMEQNILPQRK
jgi:DNA polymerase-3 subunit epsilon